MPKFSFALLAILFLGEACHGDGGAIIARQVVDDLEVTVFASPAPVRAGPVDVSVLVQRGEKSVLDATVEITCRPSSASAPSWVPPCCTMDAKVERIPALRAHSNNRLLYSAIVPMKSAGPSELLISVSQGGREVSIACEIEVQRSLPPALAFWPWLAFPPVAIAGFALHQRLAKSRHRAGSPRAEDQLSP